MENKSLKVAVVACQLPPLTGGMGMVAHSYADQLSKRGYEVTAFVSRKRTDESLGKNYRVVRLRPVFQLGYGAILPSLLWRLKNYDVVNLHYPFFGSTLFVALTKKIFAHKQKFILNYHMDINLSGWRGWYVKLAQKLFLSFILDAADKIIVSSEDYAENSLIQEYYFKNMSKFEELPFGVSRRFTTAPKKNELLEKHGLNAGDKIVYFIGGLDRPHYFKGINFLIKAFTFIKDEKIKALIAGTGDLLPHYKKMVTELRLESRVKFAGYVPDEAVVDYYNLADAFILPSINSSEAFGIVLIEAMACGKPLIASNLKGVRAVVQPGVNGLLVEPKNSKDIADKITFILGHDETYSRFSANCLESVAKRYRWSVITDKLEKLIQS